MNFKSSLFLSFTSLILFLTSCMTVSYVGDRYQPTSKVDIYYAGKDVKEEYKVIGHLSELIGALNGEERAKRAIVKKAQEVGAHAIIITGIENSGGKNSQSYQKAEAIIYTQ